MAIMDIIMYPNPIFRQICIEVTEFGKAIETLAKDMIDTVIANDGLGISAPQIGVLDRIIGLNLPGKTFCLVNPRIIEKKGNISIEESNMSMSDYSAIIDRARYIKVEGFTEKGVPVHIEAEDLESIVIQHEIDHLNGITIVDRAENFA